MSQKYSLKEIQNITSSQFNAFSKDELKRVNQKLNKIAKDRKYKMKRVDIVSPLAEAYVPYKSKNNYSRNRERAETQRLLQYVNNKTSTLGGYKKTQSAILSRLEVPKTEKNPFLNKKFAKKYWDSYNELIRVNQDIVGTPKSNELQTNLYSLMIQKKSSKDEIIDDLQKQIDKEYEKEIEAIKEELEAYENDDEEYISDYYE